ncbi:hypothetical protein Tco_1084629 [Tanacetum coccineum]
MEVRCYLHGYGVCRQHGYAVLGIGQTRPNYAPFSLSSQNTPELLHLSTLKQLKGYTKNYKNVSQDIQDQLNVEAKVVQIILTRIDNDIYSIVDACPNACEVWKAIERSQQAATRNKGKAIVNSPSPTYDQEPDMVTEDDALSKEKEIDKLMVLISLSFKKIYKSTNNNLKNSSNSSRAHQDNTPRISKGTGYDNQRAVNVAGAMENVGTQLSVEQEDWMDDTDDEPDDQELEAHYIYMTHIQEVTLDAADNSGPIVDVEPLQKVQNNDDNYNVFTNNKEHPIQPESVNDTYLEEQGDTNITIEPLDMSNNGETVDQDDDDIAKERNLLASLIEKLKCEIDDSKNRNNLLESSNKTLVD